MESKTNINPEDIVRNAYDALNRRDFEAFAATLDLNSTVDDPVYGSVRGRDALVKIEKEAFKSVPDVEISIRSMVAEGEMVAFEAVASGTFSAPIEVSGRTLQPTGRRIEFKEAAFFRVDVKGLITEGHYYYDALGLFKQMGLMP